MASPAVATTPHGPTPKVASTDVSRKFKLVADLGIMTVSVDYEHATRLTAFRSKWRAEFQGFHDSMTDEKFAEVTTQLVPGQRLQIRAYSPVNGGQVNSRDALAFALQQKSLLLGAQGLSLVCSEFLLQKGGGGVLAGWWYVGMDAEDHLYKDSMEVARMPILIVLPGKKYDFTTTKFVGDWHKQCALITYTLVADAPKPVLVADQPTPIATQAGIVRRLWARIRKPFSSNGESTPKI